MPEIVTGHESQTGVRLGVISGYYPGRRFNSYINHVAYCDQHGYHYIDASFPGAHSRPHFRKLEVIERYLGLFDWIFWIDDDAYFTDFSKPLLTFLDAVSGEQMLVCRSPSTKHAFTKFSAGQFFLRNSAASRSMLQSALRVDLVDVRDRFWSERLGTFTWGDQTAMVFLSETDPRFGDGFMKLVDHSQFNSRPFEYVSRLDEHFLLHLVGGDKQQLKRDFCKRLGVNDFLVPPDVLNRYQLREDRTTVVRKSWNALRRLIWSAAG